ncbi:hypothetical protein V12B01_13485 [Vibrio splendidus 12B01]|nr:hypothetical protein V12B01_13485 [Vibrio splendidus 12B01]
MREYTAIGQRHCYRTNKKARYCQWQ